MRHFLACRISQMETRMFVLLWVPLDINWDVILQYPFMILSEQGVSTASPIAALVRERSVMMILTLELRTRYIRSLHLVEETFSTIILAIN